jgi:hypothetical protein
VPLAFAGYFLAIPVLGGIGAAMVVAAGACAAGLGSTVIVCRVWGIRWPLTDFLKCILCSLFAYGLAVSWPVSGVVVVAKIVLLSVAVILAFLLLRLFTAHERALVRSLFRLPFGEDRTR